MAQGRGAVRRGGRNATPAGPNGKGVQLKTKVWFEVEGHFIIGDGGLRLLQGILTHGSLLGAAREMGWSYRHAWGYLKRAEEALGAALTVARSGKGTARGMTLTESGRRLAARLDEVRRRVDAAVGPTGPTAAEVAKRGGGGTAAARARTAAETRFRDGDWRRHR